MKKLICLLLAAVLLTGCSGQGEVVATVETTAPAAEPLTAIPAAEEPPYVSRFGGETVIVLSDEGITVDAGGETDSVYTSHDIIYYEDKDAYESGNPYGDGDEADKHTAEEAQAHTVVNITAPGAYRVSGKLSAGQIRIDLGEAAYEDPEAVVELILEDADITCTVAPAILFLNTYECDGMWSVETAKAEVDTTQAGANLILEGSNAVSGSYVAKIYKDKEGEKKLWKQDGAVYSYMSLNVYGPGSLELTAENEGLDTELHLTIHGGDIAIRSGNDGINTNEDGVSVTTINAGSLHIIAGLGEEGDGIDSNGYLVINGGAVVSSANPAADAGLDSDLGSYIHGGTVIALGSTMDWAQSDSRQVTMNLQFARQQSSGSAIVVTREDGVVLFAYDPAQDEVLADNARQFMGAIVSSPYLEQGSTCNVWLGGSLTGTETGGVYDPVTVTAYEDGIQMAHSGSGKLGGFGGQRPEGMENLTPPEGFDGEMPEMPEGFQPGEMPEDFTMPEGELPQGGDRGQRPQMPEGEMPDMTFPEGEMPTMPEGETFPAGEMPQGGRDDRGQMGGMEFGGQMSGESSTGFYLEDAVNAFTGVIAAQ